MLTTNDNTQIIDENNYLEIINHLNELFDRKLMIITPEGVELPFTPKIAKEDVIFETEDEEDIYEDDIFDGEEENEEDSDEKKYGDIYDKLYESEDFLFMLYDKYNINISYLIGIGDEIQIDENSGVDIIFYSIIESKKEKISIRFKDYTDDQYNNYIANSLIENINSDVNYPKYFNYRVESDKISPQLADIITKNIRKRRLVTTIHTEYGDFLFRINITDFIIFGTETKKLFSIDALDIKYDNYIEATDENYNQLADFLKEKLCNSEIEYGILSNKDRDFQPFKPIVTVLSDEEGFDINVADKYGNMEFLITKGDWIKELDNGNLLIHSEMPTDEDGTDYSPDMFLISPKEFSKEEKDSYLESNLLEYVGEILEKEFNSDDVDTIMDSLDIVGYMNRGNKSSLYSTYVTLEDGRDIQIKLNINGFKKNGTKAENIISIKEISKDDKQEEGEDE